MATKILLPRLGESVVEAAVGRWMKQVGDAVERGDVIAELETAKAMMELESPVKGVLLAAFPEIGETIQMGELVAVVGKSDEDWESQLGEEKRGSEKKEKPPVKTKEKQRHAQSSDARMRISPNAKRVARELGVDVRQAQPAQPGWRITEVDVRKLAGSGASEKMGGVPFTKIALNQVERITAQRMTKSARDIPQFSISMDVDAGKAATATEKLRKKNRKRITLTAALVKAAASTLKNHPRVNARYASDGVYMYQQVNIAVAVSTYHGLYVPVIHDADKKSLEAIAERLAELGEKSRKRKLEIADAEGGTFTISNLGMKGVRAFAPIIDPSQSAILGVGALSDRLVVLGDGSFAARKMMTLTLTCDHRVLDGAGGAEFLADLKDAIEQFA